MALRIFVQPQLDEASAPRTRQLVAPVGEWSHPLYGKVTITAATIARYAEHFAARVATAGDPPRLPFTLAHDDSRPAAGWITRVEPAPEGLFAEVEWTPAGVQAIADREYPFISPELLDDYQDPHSGHRFHDVFHGASLVTRPFFKSLPEVSLRQYAEDPEPTIVVLHPEDLMDDQVATHQGNDVPAPSAAGEQAGEVTSASPASPPGRTFSEPVDAQEFAELRSEVLTLRRERAVQRFSETARTMRFGETIGGRRLTPASRQAFAEALAELPADAAQAVCDAVAGLRFWEPTAEDDEPEVADDQPARLDPQVKQYAEQLGLSDADLAAGLETTTWAL